MVEQDETPKGLVGEPALFDKLRELTRGGYVPDAAEAPESGGIVLRHDSAPTLILNRDGSIEVPAGAAAGRRIKEESPAREKRIYWRRTFVVVILTIGVWFLSLAMTAAFIGEMVD